MIKRILAAALVATCTLIARAEPAKPTITVLAAISLKEAITEIGKDFEKTHDAKVEFVFGASGALATQIEAGSPADVFVSAADAQVNKLEKANLVDPKSRQLIANNSLVLIVPAATKSTITKFEDLANADVRRLAIGEPKSVPAGMYAQQTLKSLKLDTAVADKLIMGANVKQVLDYVVRGEADAGLVYATDAAAAKKDVTVIATADPKWHEPINYPAVVVSGSKQAGLAGEFVSALTSEDGRASLSKQGFVLPATTQPTK